MIAPSFYFYMIIGFNYAKTLLKTSAYISTPGQQILARSNDNTILYELTTIIVS